MAAVVCGMCKRVCVSHTYVNMCGRVAAVVETCMRVRVRTCGGNGYGKGSAVGSLPYNDNVSAFVAKKATNDPWFPSILS